MMKTLAPACATLSLALILALPTEAAAKSQCGSASWYELTSRTASGQMMNPNKLTAAHPSLPFGTKVRVTNQINGKTVTLRINDRGPFARGRILDVARAAASRLGFKRRGHAPVCISILG